MDQSEPSNIPQKWTNHNRPVFPVYNTNSIYLHKILVNIYTQEMDRVRIMVNEVVNYKREGRLNVKI